MEEVAKETRRQAMKCLMCKHSTLIERELPDRCEQCRNDIQFEEMTMQDVVGIGEQLYKMKLKRCEHYDEHAKAALYQDCINEAMMQYKTAKEFKQGI